MARESKAAGSPGKCASCGKGLPKGIKAKMEKCPNCGKALKTDSSAIEEALPVPVQRAARRLQEAIDRRDSASSNRDLVVARAGADVRADQLLEALCTEAVAVHHAGNFEGLHPRDRLGRWMQKLDASLRHAVTGAHGRELASLGGKLPHRGVPRSALSSPLRSLSEADVSAALAEATGAGAKFQDSLHPRDRLGKFLAKVGGLRPGQQVGFDGVGVRRSGSTFSVTGRGQTVNVLSSGEAARHAATLVKSPASPSTPGSREKLVIPPGEHGEVRPGGSEHRPGGGDSDPKRFVNKVPAASDKQHHGSLEGDDGNTGTPRGHGSAPVTPINRDKPTTAQSAHSPASGKGKADPSEASFKGSDTPVHVSHDAPKGKDDGNNAVPRGLLSSSSRERGLAQVEAERRSGRPRPRIREAEREPSPKRKRLLREEQVRLLVEAGTAQDADEAHALLDRMGV